MYLLKLIAEDWAQLWPNVFAISVWTISLFTWQHFSLKKHVSAKHEELKTHVNEHVSAIVRQLRGNDLPSDKEDS